MDKYQIMKEIEKLSKVELDDLNSLFHEFYMRKLDGSFNDSLERLRRLH